MFASIGKDEVRNILTSLSSDRLSFGIKFLDDACGGIQSNDNILLTAKTGFGKSELASTIGLFNAKQCKQVYYLALEAFKGEIELRNIFKEASTEYYKNTKSQRYISFQDYMNNILPEDFLPYINDAEEQLEFYNKYLHIKYRETEYKITDFEKDLEEISLKADLIIIDHIQFFDFDLEKENSEITRITKRIKDISQIAGIPIIVVSHMKKNMSNSSKIVPSLDDIHGTSNLQKIASKVIIISPNYKLDLVSKYEYPTIFRVAKNRYNGGVYKYIGLTMYDTRMNKYKDEYHMAKLNFDEDNYKILEEEEWPTWSKLKKK